MREQSKPACFPLAADYCLLDLESEGLLQSLAGAQCPGTGEGPCPCLWRDRQLRSGPRGSAVLRPASTAGNTRYHFEFLVRTR